MTKEIAMSLAQMHKTYPEIYKKYSYNTLRFYSSTKSEFPKPFAKSLSGKGLTWFPSEVIFFLEHKADNRGIKKENQVVKGFKGIEVALEAFLCDNNGCRALIPAEEERVIVYARNTKETTKRYHSDCAQALGIKTT